MEGRRSEREGRSGAGGSRRRVGWAVGMEKGEETIGTGVEAE